MPLAITAEAIATSHPRVPATFRDTPQFISEALSERVGRPVVVKVETVNPIGCFKGRGTWLAVAELAAGGEVGERRGLVVASAGNFGQGVAYVARAHGVPLVVFASVIANAAKMDAMRRLGADVRLAGNDFDAARQAATEHASQRGWHLLVDGQDPWIAIGAGGVALELGRAITAGELPEITSIYVPVGNGALINGVGAWLKGSGSGIRVVGVQAAGAPAMTLSWQQRRPVETPGADTVADGIAVRVPVPEALEPMFHFVDDMRLVSDDRIVEAQRELSAALPVTVEPAAAAGWAAARAAPADGALAIVLTGGNLPPAHTA